MDHEDDAATGAEDELLMKVEEEIFTQVAEDERYRIYKKVMILWVLYFQRRRFRR